MNFLAKFFFIVISLAVPGLSQGSEVKRLESDIRKLNSSIEITKQRIKGAKEIEFLPDLYFMLAELLVDKAKMSYALKKEKNPGAPDAELDFSAERQIRIEAIETYRLIEERYPNFSSLDKVIFTEGQEILQLNDLDGALKTFKKITDRFPKSPYYPRALVEIGNIFYEKKDFDFALEQYQKVINFVGATNKREFAHFKSGWCYIFKGEFLNAMLQFHRVFTLMKDVKIDPIDDIREEALIASVWPISELNTDNAKQYPFFLNALEYYRSVASDKAVYRRVLSRYAKRMVIKNRFKDSYEAYLELFRISDDLAEKKEAMENFYLKGKEAKVANYPLWVAEEAAATLWRIKQADVGIAEKRKELPKYEPFYRDFTTSMHKSAMTTKKAADLRDVVRAYEKYVWIFPRTAHVADIYLNMAEASFHAKDFIRGGEFYFKAADLTKDKNKKREFLDSAIQSFTEGFAQSDKLSNLDKMQGRAGFQRLAVFFSKEFPKDPSLPNIRFNYAKSLYDEQNFAKAADEFRIFVKNFPRHELTEQAAILLIDSFYVRDDLQNVLKEGKAIEANTSLSPELRTKMSQVVSQAQLKKVRSFAGEVGTKAYADKFLEFAKSSKGSNLSEPALLEAFAATKAANDPRLFDVGEQYVAQYGGQARAKEVLAELSQKALISADYYKAVKYQLAFAQRYKNDSLARESASQAALLAQQLGMVEESAQTYQNLGDYEKAAEVLLRGQKWSELVQMGERLSGFKSFYYQGLGQYRRGQKNEGLIFFRKSLSVGVSDDTERMMQAHAGIIVAEAEVENFITLGQSEIFSVPLLQRKIQTYQAMNQSLQNIVESGQGKWVIAALANTGKINLHFSSFLKNAKAPAGMDTGQFQNMIGPQIKNYSDAARASFEKCLTAAEEFEVFTRYVDACRSQGGKTISESLDIPRTLRAAGNPTSEVNRLRVELVKTPRSLNILRKYLIISLKAKDYAYAATLAQRMIDIDPQTAQAYGDLGVCYLYLEDWDSAQASFSEALRKDSRNATAIHGLMGLYKSYSFSKKYKKFQEKKSGVGPLEEPIHPLMR